MRTEQERKAIAYAKSKACAATADHLTLAATVPMAFLNVQVDLDDRIEFFRRWSNRWARYAGAL